MLKILTVKNLVLIDACEIEFPSGLNILSGETGAGKTAFLEAASLLLGERADTDCIRHGADKAIIEGAFEVEPIPALLKCFEELGIEHHPQEYIVLRREITRQGKSRASVNCQKVSLAIMQKIGSFLMDIIGQHSHQMLRQTDAQRELLDLFAQSQEKLSLFIAAWDQEKHISQQLETLKEKAVKRKHLLETYRRERKELEEAVIQEEEEEILFEEHHRLAHRQNLTEKASLIDQGIAEIPAKLFRYKQLCEEMVKIDPSLQECIQFLHEAAIHLRETSLFLTSYLNRQETDPHRFTFLEERLKLIDRMKRKYGNPITYLKDLQSQCNHLENLDEEIFQLQQSLEEAAQETKMRADALSTKRRESALYWEKKIVEVLRALNMPSASFKIQVEKTKRNSSGEDLVQFWLGANKGEEAVLVKENASGGELSRLLFAIKTTLAANNLRSTLVFDEIDANVGGKTAAIIAEKLKELGQCRQVLCITHFPQVAALADHHFSVFKEEKEGRTRAVIRKLTSVEREHELDRMRGI